MNYLPVRQGNLQLTTLFPCAQATAHLLLCCAASSLCELLRHFCSLSAHTAVTGPTSVGPGSNAQACEVSTAKPDVLQVLLLNPLCGCNMELLVLTNYAVTGLSVLSEQG